jgi:hypothetical protein
MLAPTLPDLSQLDREALQALLLCEHQERIATHEKLLRREMEIEHLKLLLSQLRRMQFGPKSEKLQRQIEQLELRLEDLQQAQTAEPTTQSVDRPSNGTFPAHGPSENGAAAVAGAPTTQNPDACTETLGLSRLRRRVTPAERRYFGDVGVRARLLLGDTPCAAEAELSAMRTDRASTGAEPADCARAGWTRSAGAFAGLEVCRSSPPLPAMRDL